jgi:acyl-CoA thioesterase FadM
MEYEVWAEADGEVLVSGRTLQVMYDYATYSSKRIPDDVRSAVEAVEGPFGRRGLPVEAMGGADEQL